MGVHSRAGGGNSVGSLVAGLPVFAWGLDALTE